MEKTKATKMGLSSCLLILAIIVIVVMGIFLFKINNEKNEAVKKSSELQTTVDSLNGTVNNLQQKIDSISETINSDSSDDSDSADDGEGDSFTDEQVETAFSNYLELLKVARSSGILGYLNEKGLLDYDSSNDKILDDGTVMTLVKFSDYKNAMLNFVSEKEFEKNWTSELRISEDSDGYVITAQGGGGERAYTIDSITKNDNSTYDAKTTVTLVDVDGSKEDEDFTFAVKAYNGNCVIDAVD